MSHRLIGAGNYHGIVSTDAVQPITHTFNLGAAINAAPVSFGLARGLFNVIINDTGVGSGDGIVTFYIKGGLSVNIGDFTANYFITAHPQTNIDTTLTNTGPNTMVVTNASTAAEYTIIMNSRLETATIQQTAGVPAGAVNMLITTFSF